MALLVSAVMAAEEVAEKEAEVASTKDLQASAGTLGGLYGYGAGLGYGGIRTR